MLLFCVLTTIIYVVNSQCTTEECCNNADVAISADCPNLGCAANPGGEGCYYPESTTETNCRCQYVDPTQVTPSPTSDKKSKDKGSSGFGYGICNCEGKMVELRFIYTGDTEPVNIVIDYDQYFSGINVCEFTDVMSDDEVVCKILDYVGPSGETYTEFATNTGFSITSAADDSTLCSDTYHTSCSQDIVGTYAATCDVLYVSGWKDTRSVTDPTYDCDDGWEECSCDGETTEETTEQYIPDTVIDTIVGDSCYCSTDLTPTPTDPPVQSSKSKSKSKDKNSGGLGVGDCDCDGGMVELRLLYSGSDTVNIEFNDKNGNQMCYVSDTSPGAEVICNVQTDYLDALGDPILDKLTTNTFIIVYSESGNTEICRTTIHTSCSRDIVGLNGDDSSCGTDIVVSGWKDGSDTTNDCDDGLEPCNCEDGVIIIVPDTEEDVIVFEDPDEEEDGGGYDQCYCSNIAETENINDVNDLYNLTDTTSTSTSSKDKKTKSRSKDGSSSLGFGDCDCSGGVNLLRLINIGQLIMNDVILRYKEADGDIFCEHTDVDPAEEISCDIFDAVDSNGDPLYEKYPTNTYFEITTSDGTCYGSVHTSCSQDIIGWSVEGCSDLIVTGWNDNSGGECDDGFEPCDCNESFPCDTYGDFCDDAPTAAIEGSYCCVTEGGCGACELTANANYYNIRNTIAAVIILLLIFR